MLVPAHVGLSQFENFPNRLTSVWISELVDISIVRDKKQIIIAFEGTNHHSQLLRQAFSVLFQDTVDVHGSEFGKVNRYYLNAVKQLWLDIEGAFILYPDYAPIFVGHSMGGCLASIAALLYAIECKVNSEENELNKKDISNKEHKPYFNEDQLEKIKQLTFGEPRHGDKLYAKKHNELIPHSIRYVNEEDVIAQMPFCTKFQTLFAPVLKNTALACEAIGYLHQGQEVWFKFGMKRPPIICHPPTNLVLEDNSCSASQEFHLRDSSKREKYINDHQTYFNSWVFYYGEAGCDSEKIKLHVDLVEPHYKKMKPSETSGENINTI
uniref:Fungal lipase-like domain-containing protein n=1 Tax=Ditylenchus dipsaci TaxID=166011 RepID=A0A915CQW3_9BILA